MTTPNTPAHTPTMSEALAALYNAAGHQPGKGCVPGYCKCDVEGAKAQARAAFAADPTSELIAALKQMTELGETIVTHQNREYHDIVDDSIILDMAVGICNIARAALAKARGEQS